MKYLSLIFSIIGFICGAGMTYSDKPNTILLGLGYMIVNVISFIILFKALRRQPSKIEYE
jgi:hypothetical protein